MKKFIAVLNQSGGCDYTIGCGVEVKKIDAENIETAEKKILKILKEGYPDIDSLKIYEITDEKTVDLRKFYKEIEDEKESYRQRKQEENDRAEYERLVKKFGDFKK